MKLHLLAIGVHPDDVELGCSGTILKHISIGQQVGILHLTQGELGTRGSAETRSSEAAEAAHILGVAVLENLEFADGFFKNDNEHQLKLIEVIRKYQPDIVLANALDDRHPDHGRAGWLIEEACFLSGLRRIETSHEGKLQDAWRPKTIYHYIQAYEHRPDIVVDISSFLEKKMEAIRAYKSQFYDPNSKEPQTFISTPEFMELVKARALQQGQSIGVKYGEGFNVRRQMGVKSLSDLI
ncbi:MAG: bacillithiol biosynthesis deacetylase BshB1 [Chitinophagales bacterium]|nr:bacillithiol biosynthesis deacetylase BshB1 [Chitinophagales bacterium]